ncbi:hypothetical protein UY3_02566 [Chelonia mydas]|uniref:Uncharacterized protein n=1 Tax=Chelonia mydas TaxID=8469 RepID=M7BSI4_CHEMY|nr:hypothetical protein UY3_02566 [Chelonia mydas]
MPLPRSGNGKKRHRQNAAGKRQSFSAAFQQRGVLQPSVRFFIPSPYIQQSPTPSSITYPVIPTPLAQPSLL